MEVGKERQPALIMVGMVLSDGVGEERQPALIMVAQGDGVWR